MWGGNRCLRRKNLIWAFSKRSERSLAEGVAGAGDEKQPPLGARLASGILMIPGPDEGLL